MTVLEADGRQLTLVGLTPSGVRLFLVRYDQQGISTRQLSPLLTTGMPPVSQVLADVMLCYWPLASWQSQLPPGWTLRDEGLLRRLRAPDGALVTGSATATWTACASQSACSSTYSTTACNWRP